MAEELWSEIGDAAGKIFRHLEKHGETSLPELKKNLDLSVEMFNQAIGWLAREDKILLEMQGRKKVAMLKSA